MTHFYTYESRTVACVTVSGIVRPATPDIAVCTLSQKQVCVCGKITQHTVRKYVHSKLHGCTHLLEQLAGNFAVYCCQANWQNCGKWVLVSSCLSVCPHGTLGLPMDGFLWHFIFEYFSKICRENTSFSKIWQEYRVFYMKTDIHLWHYIAHFFLEWEMFQTKVVLEIKTHIGCSVTFFPKILLFMRQCGNTGTARQDTDENIIQRMRFAYWITNLMFFWPCIMNWLYFNYQLDALTITHS